jgi:hypothetical protein
MSFPWKCIVALSAVVCLIYAGPARRAFAQSIGGNVSLTAGVASSNVQLPANIANYPTVLITYSQAAAVVSTTEVFFALGTTNAVAATLASPALPPGGICVNVGPNTWIAAIANAATAAIRITQSSICPGGR